MGSLALLKRFKVLIDWVTTFFGNRGSQVIEGELATVERAPPTVEAAR